MTLPSAGPNMFLEREGVHALQSYAIRAKQIWRETGQTDVGIDGQLEYVNSAQFATGRLIAVQVKAGQSYFDHETDDGWKYYPNDKHRNYWERFPLPVVLVLHNPYNGKSYWTDARQTLRTESGSKQAFIFVPKGAVLEDTNPLSLFETAGAMDQPFILDMNELLEALVQTRSESASFPVSFFDLFAHGLTNICRSIYYGMDLSLDIVEFNLSKKNPEFGVGTGSAEHDFLFSFVKFLVAQNLARVEYSDCLLDWLEREMHPHFVAALTPRGRQLVELIHENEKELASRGVLTSSGNYHVAQEGIFRMDLITKWPRFDMIQNFQDSFKATK